MRSKWLLASFSILALAGCQATSEDSARASGSAKAAAGKGGTGGGILRALKPEPVIVPEGTTLALVLESTISSATNRQGDLVVAKLAEDVKVADKVLLPAGSEVRGRVTAAEPSGKVKGKARLAFDFDQVVVKGKEQPIETRTVDITAPGTHKRDAAIVGGGAAGGALIGAIAGGKKGAGIGALLGAGAGTGVVLTNKGKEVEVPSGSRISVKLTREARLG